MSKLFLKDAVGWGIGLWLIGYLLGIALFFAVPPSMIGWVVTSIVVAITAWVVWKEFGGESLCVYLVGSGLHL